MTVQEMATKEAAQLVAGLAKRLIQNIETVVVGKRQVIVNVLVSLLCEGHVLIEDVPGVAKTVLAKSLAKSMGCTFHRVQCTPDLLPSDITGISIFNQQSAQFEFRPGPAFSHVLLADELNRATPRTQSALLECMAEGQVTVDGATRTLSRPFLVLATQNPIEYEGTFPLPEAQLDRFYIRTKIGYPDEEGELTMLERLRAGHPVDRLAAVTNAEEIMQAQNAIKSIFVHDEVRKYIIRIVRATRSHADVAIGASPRASIALFRTAQAMAALRGWEYVTPDVVKSMGPLVLEHRIILKPEARLNRRTPAHVIWELLEKIPAPAPQAQGASK
ncbi:MAG: AAA family ATPase [Armatimonadota bacterium]